MRTLPLLAVLALALASFSSPVGGAAEGVLEGRVINGSQDGGPVGGLEVTLAIDPMAGGELTDLTDRFGQFRFEGLSPSADDAYTLSVRYQGVDYTVGDIRMDVRDAPLQVELHVYETTTSTEAVTVLLDHHIVKASPDKRCLEVVNYIEVANEGDHTVVDAGAGDGTGASLPFTPPAGVENLQFLGTLSDTGALLDGPASNEYQAITPGEHQLLFAYELPYVDHSFVFRKSLDFDTDRAVFLVSAREGEAESRQMPALEEVDTADGAQQILTGEELPAGTVVEVTLTGLPVGDGTSLQSILAPAAVILAILVLGAVVVYARFRRRHVPAWPQER